MKSIDIGHSKNIVITKEAKFISKLDIKTRGTLIMKIIVLVSTLLFIPLEDIVLFIRSMLNENTNVYINPKLKQ